VVTDDRDGKLDLLDQMLAGPWSHVPEPAVGRSSEREREQRHPDRLVERVDGESRAVLRVHGEAERDREQAEKRHQSAPAQFGGPEQVVEIVHTDPGDDVRQRGDDPVDPSQLDREVGKRRLDRRQCEVQPVDGVGRLQGRHGQESDGAAGSESRVQVEVPAGDRRDEHEERRDGEQPDGETRHVQTGGGPLRPGDDPDGLERRPGRREPHEHEEPPSRRAADRRPDGERDERDDDGRREVNADVRDLQTLHAPVREPPLIRAFLTDYLYIRI